MTNQNPPDTADLADVLQAAIEHHQGGRLVEAEALYRQVLRTAPYHADALHLLGLVLVQSGNIQGGIELFKQAVRAAPAAFSYYNSLGNALHALGQLDAAAANFRQAIQLNPDYAEAHLNLGNALQDQGLLAEAAASFRLALKVRPDYTAAHVNLGNALQDQGLLDDAAASYRQALHFDPGYAVGHSNLGNVLCDLGQFDDAVASYRAALTLAPDLAETHSSLLFTMAYRGYATTQEYLQEARQWEVNSVAASARDVARTRTFERRSPANRRLRVGYMSGDFRQHPVSYFLEQLLAHHDGGLFEIFSYSTCAIRDETTDRLRKLSEHWRSLVEVNDEAVLRQIAADQIDVLVDLSGHTAHNRLGVFARRAAPVQAHYLGYFASTGLTEMDYWIGDRVLTPPGFETQFSEQLWRLPRVWMSYEGKAEAPPPAWRPGEDGVLWVGSFNNLGKLNDATFALWANVLHALPEAKLLLKTKDLSSPGNRRRVLEALSGHGVVQARVELHDGRTTPAWAAHMAYYDRLDVALDPVGGMGGATTTCDALWMGAPVIALGGDRVASRMTASLLDATGCSEWVAGSEVEYVEKVVALARDVGRRKVLRSQQRARVAASPLCDAKGLAEALESAYLEMFVRWFDRNN